MSAIQSGMSPHRTMTQMPNANAPTNSPQPKMSAQRGSIRSLTRVESSVSSMSDSVSVPLMKSK